MPLDINFTTIPLLRCYPNLAVLDDQQPHWKTRAEIKDSICEEDAGMCNYAIDEDSLALWQKMRAIQIAERRDEILWQGQLLPRRLKSLARKIECRVESHDASG